MNFSGEKTQIVSGGMYVSFLVLFTLILSPAVAALNVQFAEQSMLLSETTSIMLQKPSQVAYEPVHSKDDVIVKSEDKSDVFAKTSGFVVSNQKLAVQINIEQSEINRHNNQPKQQKIDINSLDYFIQIPIKFFYKKTLQDIAEAINRFQYNFKLSSFVGNITNQLTRSPIASVLLGLLCFFIFLVWLFRRQETDFIEIKTSKFNIESTAFTEGMHAKVSNEALTDKYYSNTDNTLCDVLSWVLEQDDEETDVFSGNIIPDQVDINKFISPDKKKVKQKRKNVLEAAFEKEIFSNTIGFIQEKEQPIKINHSTETFVLNSVDEIRFVNEETRNLKIDAFINMTHAEKLTDKMLSHDVDKIKNNEKFDVFIQEFEDILSNLTNDITAINNAPDDLENLLQFKLSIHFINVLSKMIQATHLTQFSTTVIEFLEDILDGNTRMTTDVTNRLIVVVNFYVCYIHSVKENSSDKIEA
jgi:hypothetical protein